MLTARGDDVDRIAGLETGADDYIAKPFNPRELFARINSVLRRQVPVETPGAPSAEADRVDFGPFELDLGTRTLTRQGEAVPLTTGEFSLLKALAQNPRKPMSRDKLMELARGRALESADRSIDVQVSRLRRPAGEDPQGVRHPDRGAGYVFVPDGASAQRLFRAPLAHACAAGGPGASQAAALWLFDEYVTRPCTAVGMFSLRVTT
jgi:two-component system phosphate regulon response regulator OmpR